MKLHHFVLAISVGIRELSRGDHHDRKTLNTKGLLDETLKKSHTGSSSQNTDHSSEEYIL